MVEFAFILPLFMLVFLGIFEFGFMFSHHMTLETATREGARAGAAAANGSMTDSSCVDSSTGLSRSFGAPDVDPLVIAAVQRVLKSPGSMVDISKITNITIYKAQADGSPVGGTSNVWTLKVGAGATVPCVFPAQLMDFQAPGTAPWPASSRVIGATPDSIGVSITYNYQLVSPLGGILKFFGGSNWGQVTMNDKTVMALQPTS